MHLSMRWKCILSFLRNKYTIVCSLSATGIVLPREKSRSRSRQFSGYFATFWHILNTLPNILSCASSHRAPRFQWHLDVLNGGLDFSGLPTIEYKRLPRTRVNRSHSYTRRILPLNTNCLTLHHN